MAQKVCVLLTGITTEATKDKVILAAQSVVSNLPAGAAEVLRDANGKVIEVRLVIPDTAADAAKTAISATNGVANVIVGDIIPGTVGFDGSEEGKATILSIPGSIYQVGGPQTTETFNADGSVTYDLDPEFGDVAIVIPNVVPVHPTPYTLTAAFTVPQMGDTNINLNVEFRAINEVAQSRMLILSNDAVVSGVPGAYIVSLFGSVGTDDHIGATAAALGTGKHEYSYTFDGQKLTGFLDGVQVLQTGNIDQPGTLPNFVQLGINGNANDGVTRPQVTVDFIRWTQI